MCVIVAVMQDYTKIHEVVYLCILYLGSYATRRNLCHDTFCSIVMMILNM